MFIILHKIISYHHVGDRCSVISEPDINDLASKELSDL